MQKKIKVCFLCFVTFLVVVQACKHKDVAPRPAVNANDYIFNTSDSNWVYDNADSSYNLDHNITQITQDIVDNGSVEVFLKDSTGNWQALPFNIKNLQYMGDYQLGNVSVTAKNSKGTIPSNPSVQQFKVVVIPPPLTYTEDTP